MFNIILLAVALSAVTSFTTPNTRSFGYRLSTGLQSRIDSADAVNAALETSKKYGATSKEARLAWEEVEEMDSSDNSVAYSGGVTDDECDTDAANEKCKEYEEKKQSLAELLQENKEKLNAMKTLVQEVQSMKLPMPATSSSSAVDVTMIKDLIAKATEASDKFGNDSNEAKLAWENVEEVSASDNSAPTQPDLEELCLVEAIEACEALEELGRVIALAGKE